MKCIIKQKNWQVVRGINRERLEDRFLLCNLFDIVIHVIARMYIVINVMSRYSNILQYFTYMHNTGIGVTTFTSIVCHCRCTTLLNFLVFSCGGRLRRERRCYVMATGTT